MHRFRNRAVVLAPLAVLALGAAACGGSSAPSTSPSTTVGNTPKAQQSVKPGGSATFAYAQSCPGFNVNNGNDALEICSLIVSPSILPATYVAYPDFSLHYNPDLLTAEPTQDTSSGKQVITYKINPNAKWSDGQPIDVKDFQYMWKSCNGVNTKFLCATTTGYDQIERITGQDNGKTVTVTFKKPFVDWQGLWGTMLPAHVFASGGPNAFNKKLEGNSPDWTGGAFKITGFQKDQSVTLSRWDGYYGKKANLDTVTFRFLADESAEPQALANNEVQLIYPQPQLDLIAQVKNIPNVTNEINLGAVFEHFDFNEKSPLLKDKAVRTAIFQATDRTQMLNATVKQFTNKAQVLNNRIFMPGQKGYQDNSGGLGMGNVQQAQQTLEKAGWKKSGNVYMKNGKPLALTISTTAGNQLRQNQETIFKQQMTKVGIQISIKNYPADKFFGDVVPNENYDIADFAWVGTPLPVSSNVSIYQCHGGENWVDYCNKQVDQWMQEAVTSTDASHAISLMNQVDKQLWADAVTLPLYQKPTMLAYYNKYANVQDNPTSQGPTWNIASWGVKAK